MAEAHCNSVKRMPHRLRWLDLTLPDPAANLLFDEELLGAGEPVLRVWEASSECVVLGRSGIAEREVRGEACEAAGVPILRRCSGGGTVVLGPGCLNYAVVLPFEWDPAWSDVPHSVRWVMRRMRDALAIPGLQLEGQSDLTLHGRKVSGNAQRRVRHAFLHHGTLLYGFNASRAEELLAPLPRREPDYRQGRAHTEFLTNLPIDAAELKARLLKAWC